MITPGPKNLITDVQGILVGNSEDLEVRSGTTVVLADPPALCAVDVRGGGPGTRETDALDAVSLVEHVDAVVLSGGSAFGLDAASGVMSYLAALGRGFEVGKALVPIVPAAILFDLANGGNKNWGLHPPYRELGFDACEQAGDDFLLGNQGAGLGAMAGPLKGGLGSASCVMARDDDLMPITIGVLVVVNAAGSTVMPGTSAFWAWPFEQEGEFGGRKPFDGTPSLPADELPLELAANTTLVVVATDADLTRNEARRVAIMAHDGLARAIRPVHTPYDGDTVFVLATGGHRLINRPRELTQIGALAADTVARAIGRGVYEAKDLGDMPCYRSVHEATRQEEASLEPAEEELLDDAIEIFDPEDEGIDALEPVGSPPVRHRRFPDLVVGDSEFERDDPFGDGFGAAPPRSHGWGRRRDR